MDEFADYLPSIKASLIDERDVFLARSIASAPGKNIFVVLGAGSFARCLLVLERIFGENVRSIPMENGPLLDDKPAEKLEEGQGAQADKNGIKENAAEQGQKARRNNPSSCPHGSPTLLCFRFRLTKSSCICPKRRWLPGCYPWLLPALAVGIMVSGFFFSDTQKALARSRYLGAFAFDSGGVGGYCRVWRIQSVFWSRLLLHLLRRSPNGFCGVANGFE